MGSLPVLTISQVDMPSPTSLQVSIMDISRAERNANGNMTIERINTKVKLTVGYDYISASDLQTLLSKISATYFDVLFFDPRINQWSTKSMYCGDRNIGMLDFWGGVARWKDVSFDLIER